MAKAKKPVVATYGPVLEAYLNSLCESYEADPSKPTLPHKEECGFLAVNVTEIAKTLATLIQSKEGVDFQWTNMRTYIFNYPEFTNAINLVAVKQGLLKVKSRTTLPTGDAEKAEQERESQRLKASRVATQASQAAAQSSELAEAINAELQAVKQENIRLKSHIRALELELENFLSFVDVIK